MAFKTLTIDMHIQVMNHSWKWFVLYVLSVIFLLNDKCDGKYPNSLWPASPPKVSISTSHIGLQTCNHVFPVQLNALLNCSFCWETQEFALMKYNCIEGHCFCLEQNGGASFIVVAVRTSGVQLSSCNKNIFIHLNIVHTVYYMSYNK